VLITSYLRWQLSSVLQRYDPAQVLSRVLKMRVAFLFASQWSINIVQEVLLFILHYMTSQEFDAYWMMLSAIPTLQRRVINWKPHASGHYLICGTIPTFFRGKKEVFRIEQLWAKNYICDSQIRRSALVLQLPTYLMAECFHLDVHTYIHFTDKHSSIDRWMWNMSDTMGWSMQLGQRNILNKSIYKIYVGETLK